MTEIQLSLNFMKSFNESLFILEQVKQSLAIRCNLQPCGAIHDNLTVTFTNSSNAKNFLNSITLNSAFNKIGGTWRFISLMMKFAVQICRIVFSWKVIRIKVLYKLIFVDLGFIAWWFAMTQDDWLDSFLFFYIHDFFLGDPVFWQ